MLMPTNRSNAAALICKQCGSMTIVWWSSYAWMYRPTLNVSYHHAISLTDHAELIEQQLLLFFFRLREFMNVNLLNLHFYFQSYIFVSSQHLPLNMFSLYKNKLRTMHFKTQTNRHTYRATRIHSTFKIIFLLFRKQKTRSIFEIVAGNVPFACASKKNIDLHVERRAETLVINYLREIKTL